MAEPDDQTPSSREGKTPEALLEEAYAARQEGDLPTAAKALDGVWHWSAANPMRWLALTPPCALIPATPTCIWAKRRRSNWRATPKARGSWPSRSRIKRLVLQLPLPISLGYILPTANPNSRLPSSAPVFDP